MQTLVPTAVRLNNLAGAFTDLDESPDSTDGRWCTRLGYGYAVVDWDAPTANSAGQSFDSSTNDRTLSGYKIYYGTNESQVLAGTSSSVTVAAGTTIYAFTSLASGTWYFRVVAYDGDGDESTSAASYSKVIP